MRTVYLIFALLAFSISTYAEKPAQNKKIVHVDGYIISKPKHFPSYLTFTLSQDPNPTYGKKFFKVIVHKYKGYLSNQFVKAQKGDRIRPIAYYSPPKKIELKIKGYKGLLEIIQAPPEVTKKKSSNGQKKSIAKGKAKGKSKRKTNSKGKTTSKSGGLSKALVTTTGPNGSKSPSNSPSKGKGKNLQKNQLNQVGQGNQGNQGGKGGGTGGGQGKTIGKGKASTPNKTKLTGTIIDKPRETVCKSGFNMIHTFKVRPAGVPASSNEHVMVTYHSYKDGRDLGKFKGKQGQKVELKGYKRNPKNFVDSESGYLGTLSVNDEFEEKICKECREALVQNEIKAQEEEEEFYKQKFGDFKAQFNKIEATDKSSVQSLEELLAEKEADTEEQGATQEELIQAKADALNYHLEYKRKEEQKRRYAEYLRRKKYRSKYGKSRRYTYKKRRNGPSYSMPTRRNRTPSSVYGNPLPTDTSPSSDKSLPSY